jgi:hypothetical protein
MSKQYKNNAKLSNRPSRQKANNALLELIDTNIEGEEVKITIDK